MKPWIGSMHFCRVGRIGPMFAICGAADQGSVSAMCPQRHWPTQRTTTVPAFGLVRSGIPNGIRTRAAALKGRLGQ